MMSKTTTSPKTPASTRIVTGPRTRFSYCHLWEPRSSYGNEPKYSMSCIIPKDDTKTVALINGAIEAAYREGEAKLKGKGAMPPLTALRTPLRDGDLDRPDDPAYAGCWFLNASASTAPGIVDAQAQPILDRAEVYSGCYGRVSLTFYAYNTNGNRGIACGLNNVQKIRDGEPLGGHMTAEQEFAAFTDDDDEDFLN